MRKLAGMLLFSVLALTASLWADPGNEALETNLIDSFDGAESGKYPIGTLDKNGTDVSDQTINWRVTGSRYVTEDYPQKTYVERNWPIDLWGIAPENAETLQTYGVRVKFDRQGYNYFSIVPAVGEEPVSVPLSDNQNPGIVKRISLWAWGANYNYTIEVYVRDYLGISHTLALNAQDKNNANSRFFAGSLDFRGWKRMSVDVPVSIPQNSDYGIQDSRLKLIKIVVRTAPNERVDDYTLYIDELKVLIDRHNSFYDGKDLASPEKISEIWDNVSADNTGGSNDGQ